MRLYKTPGLDLLVEPAVGQAIANHLIDHGRKVAALLGRHAVALLAKLDLGLQQLNGR